jgi:NAD(P)-dependent dehydrogenase (short-subunit alcohol dehydrogenase family)
MRFEGKAAIVTGAANGIGEATAHKLAAEGARVTAVDVAERGEEVVEAIRSAGGQADFVQADLAEEEAAADAVEAALRRWGSLDVLVNDAAVTLPKGFEATTTGEWDRVQAVNLRAPYLLMRHAAPLLREAGQGASVVNVASFHTAATIENFAAYAAAKSGLIGLTRSAALDLGPAGVRVNAVCPGIVETEMWRTWLDGVEDREDTIRQVEALQPLGRVGLPDDVANAICFLASPEAAYVTGTALFVDGGVSARLSHV